MHENITHLMITIYSVIASHYIFLSYIPIRMCSNGFIQTKPWLGWKLLKVTPNEPSPCTLPSP